MTGRILVVDDEAHIVEFVRGYLERDGYEVLTASDGDTAVSIAEEARPDLLVLDVMLPGLSGLLEVQPFRYTLSFPLEILTGSLSAPAAWASTIVTP